ncbi:hypothetical protein KR018_006207 [Drosophila ironensis]|nr:hypothetical protein KR018_006207 [Drosophila ironensis]
MGDFSYVIVKVGWLLIVVIVAILAKVCCMCARKNNSTDSPSRGPGPGRHRRRNSEPVRVLQSYRIDPSGVSVNTDRQGNVFNVPEDRSHNRYGDIFFIEPGSEEANRIREQLEKDDKELPSYDEVMRMCNLTTPTAAAGLPQSPHLDPPAPIGIAALPAVPAPPYSETDPESTSGGIAIIVMDRAEPSTSRAAQIPSGSSTSAQPPAPAPVPEPTPQALSSQV